MRLAVALLVVLFVAGGASGAHNAVEQGETSTGERDGHPNPLEFGCGDAIGEWRVTLELHGPGAHDLVRLRSGRPSDVLGPAGLRGSVGVLASASRPTVAMNVTHGELCTPPMTVEGLFVEAVLPYTIRYEGLN